MSWSARAYLRDRSKKGKKKKKATRPTIQVYTSSEGIDIYVGKNNLQNEYVTNRLASPNDTWLHTKDIPGSHVVIRSEAFGDATLRKPRSWLLITARPSSPAACRSTAP